MNRKHKISSKISTLSRQKLLLAGVILLVAIAGVVTLVLTRAASTTISINDNTIGTGTNQWQYTGSDWQHYTDGGTKYEGDDHSSSTAGDYATLKFSGTKAQYYGAKSPQAGIVGVSIDNGTETMVDLYSATRTDNTLLYTSPTVTSGTHTMKIRLTGTKNASAAAAAAGVDRAVVTVDTGNQLFSSLEAEEGTLSGNASRVTDSTASGGAAVKFQAASTGGGTGTWWSGESESSTVANGSFASWRGRPIEIGGQWAATTDAGSSVAAAGWVLAPGTPFGNIPRMDWAIGGMLDNAGESWGAAANGSYDSRWAQQLQALKSAWGSRKASDMYIRFAHEFNGNWYPWSVDTGNVENFKTAWKRFYGLVQTNFPGAKVVWCPNAGSSWNYDIRNLYPGDGYVDVVSVDQYNNYPWVNTKSAFDAKISSVSSFGGPTGMESFRQFAQTHGKPMGVSEWSNAGISNQGGGGESPEYIQYFHDWLVANGSQTPQAGKVLYEVHFNVTGYGDHYSFYPLDAESGNTTTAAKYIQLW